MYSAFARTIYLDMDGVVADFNFYVGRLLNRTIGWGGKDLSDEEWSFISKQNRLYYQLPVIMESRELVKTATSSGLKVKFLTAIPRRTTMPSAEADKREWLELNFPGIKMEIGPYSKDKQKWARWGDILVDDKQSNVEEWKEAGGISIYHTGNFKNTIDNLKTAITITSPTLLN